MIDRLHHLHYCKLFNLLNIPIDDKFVIINRNRHSSENELAHLQKILDMTNLRVMYVDSADPYSNNHDQSKLKIYQQYEIIKQSFGDRVIILSSDANDMFDQSNNQMYFPSFLLHQILNSRQFDTPNNNRKFFRFSFLSSQIRFHRLWLFQCAKSFITDRDCFVVHKTNYRDYDSNFAMTHSKQYLGYATDLYQDIPYYSIGSQDKFVDIFANDAGNGGDHNIDHPAYSAVFNITGETSVESDQIFISEKTWKPIRSMNLPLCLGNPNTNSMLQRWGFETGHDRDLPFLEKIQWISTIMRDWDYAECLKFYNHHEDIVKHNYHRLHDAGLLKQFRDYILPRLKL
jgi:hypothetical protein